MTYVSHLILPKPSLFEGLALRLSKAALLGGVSKLSLVASVAGGVWVLSAPSSPKIPSRPSHHAGGGGGQTPSSSQSGARGQNIFSPSFSRLSEEETLPSPPGPATVYHTSYVSRDWHPEARTVLPFTIHPSESRALNFHPPFADPSPAPSVHVPPPPSSSVSEPLLPAFEKVPEENAGLESPSEQEGLSPEDVKKREELLPGLRKFLEDITAKLEREAEEALLFEEDEDLPPRRAESMASALSTVTSPALTPTLPFGFDTINGETPATSPGVLGVPGFSSDISGTPQNTALLLEKGLDNVQGAAPVAPSPVKNNAPSGLPLPENAAFERPQSAAQAWAAVQLASSQAAAETFLQKCMQKGQPPGTSPERDRNRSSPKKKGTPRPTTPSAFPDRKQPTQGTSALAFLSVVQKNNEECKQFIEILMKKAQGTPIDKNKVTPRGENATLPYAQEEDTRKPKTPASVKTPGSSRVRRPLGAVLNQDSLY